MIGNPESQYKELTRSHLQTKINTISHDEEPVTKVQATHFRERNKSFLTHKVPNPIKKTEQTTYIAASRRRNLEQEYIQEIKDEIF